MRFTFGEALLTTKLIDGTFPDYGRVIPAGNDKRLTVERDVFAKAVDRVSTISSERGRAVKLAAVRGQAGALRHQSRSGLGGRGDSRPITTARRSTSASTPAICSTSRNQLDSDTALFQLADPGSPTLIQDRDGASALYVLMPMRV